jgi:putative ABC transport system permease protein
MSSVSRSIVVIGPYKSTLSRVTNPRGDIDALVVQAPTREGLDDALESVREVMRGFRRLPPARPDNFALETSDAALSFFNELKGKLILFGTALPAIGLVVGAMVIMNIMLVAVAERTREIGIRKALGAKRRHPVAVPRRVGSTQPVRGSHRHRTRDRTGKVVAAISPLRRALRRGPSRSRSSSGRSRDRGGMYPATVRLARPITALRQE